MAEFFSLSRLQPCRALPQATRGQVACRHTLPATPRSNAIAAVQEKVPPPIPSPVSGSKYSLNPLLRISAPVAARMSLANSNSPESDSPSTSIQFTTAQTGPRQYRRGSKRGSAGSVEGTRWRAARPQRRRVAPMAEVRAAGAPPPNNGNSPADVAVLIGTSLIRSKDE